MQYQKSITMIQREILYRRVLLIDKCCPFYTHFFQDEEMWKYASSMNKAVHSQKAILNHYHPAFKKDELDSTHAIVRTSELLNKDQEIFNRRQKEHKIWGDSFAE